MAEAFSLGFLKGGGMMGAAIRSNDWSKTSLGDPEWWPQTLKTTLNIILHSGFPMFLWWGPELTCFYNDAYRPSLGDEGKHPCILGMPAVEAWSEIWPVISPMIRQVIENGETIWREDQLIPIYRNNALEDVYWTFSYSPVYNEKNCRVAVLVTCNETTEKVRILKETAEREEHLFFTIESAELGTWEYKPISRRFSANKRLKEWFGLSPEGELRSQEALNIVVPEDRERLIYAVKEALQFGSSLGFDETYRIINPVTKIERTIRAKGKAYFNEEKIASKFSGTAEDISEEVKIRRYIQQKEQNFRNLIEHAPVAMCVFTGPDFTVELANEKMIGLWGKYPGQVIRKPLFEAVPEAKTQGLETILEEVYKTGKRFVAHERMVEWQRGGKTEKTYVNFVYEALKSCENEVFAIMAVAIDVTEQVLFRKKVEEAEERARLAIEAGNLGAFDFNPLTHQAIISPRLLEIFGLPDCADWSVLLDKIIPEDRIVRENAFQEALLTGKLFYEVRIQYDEDDVRWVRAQGRVIYNDNNDHVRILGIMMDITESKLADQKREEYIAIASHELRNPLTSLNLSLELLEVSAGPEENDLLIRKAQSQLKRLLNMTHEFLNVSKISSGILDLKPEVCNLCNIVEESIETFQAGRNAQKITTRGNADITIMADRFRIEQVIINLLSNASKYSPRGEEIRVNLERDQQFVKVSVIDKGLGIEEEKMPSLFKKFIRIEHRSKSTGYGLGLYISEQIVRKHGGKMGVSSEKGRGSVFWFTLPI
jgi:PAS domain S-box-containing protein